MSAKIGCCAVVVHPTEPLIAGVICNKGRGLIIPGGKHEPDKDRTYRDTVIREVEEEVGITKMMRPQMFFSGLDRDGYFVYTFLCEAMSYEIQSSSEGEAIWTEKLDSDLFAAYYDLMWETFYEKFILNDNMLNNYMSPETWQKFVRIWSNNVN